MRRWWCRLVHQLPEKNRCHKPSFLEEFFSEIRDPTVLRSRARVLTARASTKIVLFVSKDLMRVCFLSIDRFVICRQGHITSNPPATAGHKEKRHGKLDEEHYREPGAAARKGWDLFERDPGEGYGRHRRGLLRRAALPGPVAQ